MLNWTSTGFHASTDDFNVWIDRQFDDQNKVYWNLCIRHKPCGRYLVDASRSTIEELKVLAEEECKQYLEKYSKTKCTVCEHLEKRRAWRARNSAV